MPDLAVPFFVVSVLFGALMGFVLGRRAEDRPVTIAATVFCTIVGMVAWVVGSTGGTSEVAGASMTVGGVTAAMVLVATGRRQPSPD
jgi:hypothetical protein